jgi:hypothetical protein
MTVDGKLSMKGSLLTYLLVAFSRFFWLDSLRPQGVSGWPEKTRKFHKYVKSTITNESIYNLLKNKLLPMI